MNRQKIKLNSEKTWNSAKKYFLNLYYIKIPSKNFRKDNYLLALVKKIQTTSRKSKCE
jgi:hypothetical protein